MAHHKRKRPANRRAGCKLCKPWKNQRSIRRNERRRESVEPAAALGAEP